MKRQTKSLISICLAFLMIFSLVGCNKTEQDSKITSEILQGNSKKEVLELLNTELNRFRSQSTAISLQYGTDMYASYIYSNNKEAMVQYDVKDATTGIDTSIMHVYLKNGGMITLEQNQVSYTKGVDILTLMERVLYLAEIGVGTMIKEDIDDEGYDYYAIDIRGYDNIYSLYDFVDEGLAYENVESLKQTIATQYNSDKSVDVDHVNIRIEFAVIKDEELAKHEGENPLSKIVSAAQYTYTGIEESTKVEHSALSADWIYNGYHLLGDWQLEDGWYTYDWESLDSAENIEEVDKLLITDYKKVDALLTELFNESNNNEEVDSTQDNIKN